MWLVGSANTLFSRVSDTEWVWLLHTYTIRVLPCTLLFLFMLAWTLKLYWSIWSPEVKLGEVCAFAAWVIMVSIVTNHIVFDHDYNLTSAFEASTLKTLCTLILSVILPLLAFIIFCGIKSLYRIISLSPSLQGILLFFDKCAKVGSPIPTVDVLYGGAVYLDYNGDRTFSTTPVFPEVARAMLPYLGQYWGNPSTSNVFGRRCMDGLSRARDQVASLLDCSPEEVTFVSCGTEANNWAIQGAIDLKAHQVPSHAGRPHIIASAVEHPSILECLAEHAKKCIDVTLVPVSKEGIISVSDMMKIIRPTTILVTIMNSNNEVGSIQPIKEVAQLCSDKGILFHTDAAQSIGKIPVKFRNLGVDMLTVVGHKFGAPKGIGVLIVREGLCLPPLLFGGKQEAGRRSGTENVLLAVGMGAAAQIVSSELEITKQHMRNMRDRLATKLLTALGPELKRRLVRIGPECADYVLPNTLSISIRGINACALQQDLKDSVALSCGSACHQNKVSPVLKAMGISTATVRGFLRISTGRHTTVRDIDIGAKLIAKAARSQFSTLEH